MSVQIQKAYDYIKVQIMNKQLHPNTHLFEERLADELEMSRSPIRQAFRQLVDEGLLIKETNRGVRVADWHIDQAALLDRLGVLELFLIDQLFLLEKNRVQLSHTLFSEADIKGFSDLPALLFLIQNIFAYSHNQYEKDCMNEILSSFLKKTESLTQKVQQTSEETFKKYLPSLLTSLEDGLYPEARKEIRILINQIKIDLIQS